MNGGTEDKDKRRNITDTVHEQDQYTVRQTWETSPHQPTLTPEQPTHSPTGCEPSKRIPPSVSFLTTVSRTARLWNFHVAPIPIYSLDVLKYALPPTAEASTVIFLFSLYS